MDGAAGFNHFQGNQVPNAGNNAIADADADAAAPNNGTGIMVREQDVHMPIANVTRIMRRVLPSYAKISDEAKEAIKECVTEYIRFITGEANERCQTEHRRIITAEDVIWAMSKLGFDDYIDPLTLFLNKYREAEGDNQSSVRGEPLPVRQLRSVGTRNSLLPVQPAPVQPAPMPMNPAMFVPPQQQQLGMNPIPWMNAGLPQQQQLQLQQQQQQQQPGAYGNSMARYYLGSYGNGTYDEGSSSGSAGPFAPYK